MNDVSQENRSPLPATPELTQPVLQFVEATKIYGEGNTAVTAVGPVSLDIFPGEFVALMGPSGSGKSTLLSMAGALDQPTEGQVLVEGRALTDHSNSELATLRRTTIGYVFQDFNLLPGLTAVENVALPLELDGQSLKDTRRTALSQLESVGVGALAHRFPEELSGGERQRVAVARAFVGPRRLLLADEPTGALDSFTGEAVMTLLRSKCDQGRTVVLVTHDASHAAFADRILHLRDGQLLRETSSSNRSHEPKQVVELPTASTR